MRADGLTTSVGLVASEPIFFGVVARSGAAAVADLAERAVRTAGFFVLRATAFFDRVASFLLGVWARRVVRRGFLRFVTAIRASMRDRVGGCSRCCNPFFN